VGNNVLLEPRTFRIVREVKPTNKDRELMDNIKT